MDRCPGSGKIKHSSKGSAYRELKILEKKRNRPKGRLSVYRCECCGEFHITRTEKTSKKVSSRGTEEFETDDQEIGG